MCNCLIFWFVIHVWKNQTPWLGLVLQFLQSIEPFSKLWNFSSKIQSKRCLWWLQWWIWPSDIQFIPLPSYVCHLCCQNNCTFAICFFHLDILLIHMFHNNIHFLLMLIGFGNHFIKNSTSFMFKQKCLNTFYLTVSEQTLQHNKVDTLNKMYLQ